MNKPLLSIAIPTYNRCVFLDKALKSIYDQITGIKGSIEIIVSDNCSTDNTKEVVESYIRNGLSVTYLLNETNKGPDFNITQCFFNTNGKFVLILGDDDFFIDGALQKIVNVLNVEHDAGVVYVKGVSYDKEFNLNGTINTDHSYYVHHYKDTFLREVNFYLTFISGNILNKNYFDRETDVSEFNNSYLIQLSWIFSILINSAYNITIEGHMLGVGSVENTGGYKLFEVFGRNFNNIMHSFRDKGLNQGYIDIINKNLLCSFFPGFFYANKMAGNSTAFDGKVFSVLKDTFEQYKLFWVVIWPLNFLPKRVCKFGLSGALICKRYLGFISNKKFKRALKLGEIEKRVFSLASN